MKKRKVKAFICLGSYVLLLAYCSLHKFLPSGPMLDTFMFMLLLVTSLVGLYCSKDL